MVTIPFNVNDEKIRRFFFDKVLIDCIVNLSEDSKSLWGTMTAHDMIEHLIWAFECSTGAIKLPCRTPVNIIERTKRFLYDNKPTPHEFKNPLLDENPLPHRFPKYSEAKDVLLKNIINFTSYFDEHTEAVHTHPIFGALGAEEWQRSQYKHCYHHLLQFGLIRSTESIIVL